jgi:hypothetical protein
VVEKEYEPSSRLNFDTTFAIVSPLAFNDSLGDTLPDNELYGVLGRRSQKDLPIRAIHVRIIVSSSEMMQTRRLKTEVSAILNNIINLYEKNPDSYVIGNRCGELCSLIGSWLQTSSARPPNSYKSLGSAILGHVLDKAGLPEEGEKARRLAQTREGDESLLNCLLACPLITMFDTAD